MKAERGADADQDHDAPGLVGDADLASLGGVTTRQGVDLTPDGVRIEESQRFHIAAASRRIDQLEMVKGHDDLVSRQVLA